MAFRKTEEQLAQEVAARQAAARAASPVGRAEAAHERGDSFFEIRLSLDVSNETSQTAPEVKSYGNIVLDVVSYAVSTGMAKRSSKPEAPVVSTDVLGDIERAGWRLEHAGYVYVPSSSFRSSGGGDRDDITHHGRTDGIYLFRRANDV